jgi:hypothetical protein
MKIGSMHQNSTRTTASWQTAHEMQLWCAKIRTDFDSVLLFARDLLKRLYGGYLMKLRLLARQGGSTLTKLQDTQQPIFHQSSVRVNCGCHGCHSRNCVCSVHGLRKICCRHISTPACSANWHWVSCGARVRPENPAVSVSKYGPAGVYLCSYVRMLSEFVWDAKISCTRVSLMYFWYACIAQFVRTRSKYHAYMCTQVLY